MTATADAYRIFEVERRGDALIVTPVADPVGFPPNQLAAELRHLRDEFDARRRNLVLDFGGMGYHGATMLTALDGLFGDVRRRGGSVAVVGLPDDDLTVLNAYGLAGRWPIHADLAAATAAVVHESARERLWRKRRFLAALAAVLLAPLVTAAIAFALTVHPHVAAVRDMEAVLADYRLLRWRTASGHPRDKDAVYALRARTRAVTGRVQASGPAPPELNAASVRLTTLVSQDRAGDEELAEVQQSVAEARRAVEAHLAGETPVRTATRVASDPAAAAPVPATASPVATDRPDPTARPAAVVIPASGESSPTPPAAAVNDPSAPDGPSEVISAHAEADGR